MAATRMPPMEEPVVKRPGGRTARIRQAVFDATLELVANKGYAALTIEEVAETAGVNKTTIYRNWPTRAKLIQAAAADRSATAIVAKNTGDLEHDLKRLLESVARYITSPVGRSLVVAALSESHEPGVRQAQEKFWEIRFAAVRPLTQSQLGDPSVADDVIEHLIGPLFLRAFVTNRPIDRAFINRTAMIASNLTRPA